MGPSHRLFGALAGAALAHYTGRPFADVTMAALVASSTAHGWSSPDMDQTKPWRAAGRLLPGEAHHLAAHRTGLSHWWGLPVLMWFLVIQHLPAGAEWPATVLLIGWVSHLLGDLVFGKLALYPWGGPSFGLELDTGGFIETGRTHMLGRQRIVLPFGPVRVAIVGALLWVLASAPGLTAVATIRTAVDSRH